MDHLWIIVMYLSAVWTHSDGTHSQRISDIILKLSKKHTTWPEDPFSAIFG